LDNKQKFIQNKRNKKDDDDKDPGGSGLSRNPSIMEISSQEFTKSTEKFSSNNEKKNNNNSSKRKT
jgi:hypothetical protein